MARWIPVNEFLPDYGVPVVTISLVRYANADWHWDTPRIQVRNESHERWAARNGAKNRTFEHFAEFWRPISLPPVPDSPERREARALAEKLADLDREQKALDEKYRQLGFVKPCP